jgi:hypothetical protein
VAGLTLAIPRESVPMKARRRAMRAAEHAKLGNVDRVLADRV